MKEKEKGKARRGIDCNSILKGRIEEREKRNESKVKRERKYLKEKEKKREKKKDKRR